MPSAAGDECNQGPQQRLLCISVHFFDPYVIRKSGCADYVYSILVLRSILHVYTFIYFYCYFIHLFIHFFIFYLFIHLFI